MKKNASSTKTIDPPPKILPAGSAKTFGYSRLDQKGIHSGRDYLPWESLDEFTTQNGAITVTLKKDD